MLAIAISNHKVFYTLESVMLAHLLLILMVSFKRKKIVYSPKYKILFKTLDSIMQTSLAPSLPHTRVIASKSSLNAFGENLLAKKIDEATIEGLTSHNMSKAHHMAETFKDIHAALVSKNNKHISVIPQLIQ